MLWNAEAETLPRERLEALQLQRVRWTVDRLLQRVPPRREQLTASGLRSSSDVASLADLQRLPFTTKHDLREHYPWGLFSVPRDEIVRIHASSGTMGKPTVVGYTRNDLGIWAEVIARALAAAGVEPGMVVHNAFGYGLFTGGIGFHYGAELMGCTVVPMSGGFTARQVLMLEDLGAEVLLATPSYALNIAQALAEHGVGHDRLKLRMAICGAEPWTVELRDTLDCELGVQSFNHYGLSEIVGPGVASECGEARDGAHIQEDHFLVEVVDPASGSLLPDGAEGELVFTTLTKEALPMLRYRTGDIAAIDSRPCMCGRTTVRMGRVRGRVDDMLIIRGVNLYPSEVERVLLTVDGVAPHYQLVVDRPAAMDELTVICEPASDAADVATLQRRVERAMQRNLGLSSHAQVVERGAVPRSEGKAVRVIDRRPR